MLVSESDKLNIAIVVLYSMLFGMFVETSDGSSVEFSVLRPEDFNCFANGWAQVCAVVGRHLGNNVCGKLRKYCGVCKWLAGICGGCSRLLKIIDANIKP
eukprot:IDg17823t1